MKIDAGKLDRRLTVSAKTRTQDDYGEVVETWTVVSTIYAQRLELRQSDIARAAGRETQSLSRFLIRYRAGLTVGQRLDCDGTTYEITSIDEPDRRSTLVLTVASV